MKNIIERINKLQRLKHKIGMHDQREHGNWSKGPGMYGGEVDIPMGKRLTAMNQLQANRQNIFGSDFAYSDDVKLRRTDGRNTRYDENNAPELTINQSVHDAAQNPREMPNALTLARYFIERGYQITHAQSDRQRTAGWGRGDKFFEPVSNANYQKVTPEILEKKSAAYQRAYMATLQAYQGKDISAEELAITAEEFARHVSFLTNHVNSPYRVARDLSAMGNIESFINQVTPGTSGEFDVGLGMIHELRKKLAVPRDLWRKYISGESIQENGFEAMTTELNFGKISYDDANYYLSTAMATGNDSIFGYLSKQFPEMRAYLVDLFNQMRRGYGSFKLPSQLLQVQNEDNYPVILPNTDGRTTIDSFPNTPSNLPTQNDSSDYIKDDRTGMQIPRSSVELANLIDPYNAVGTTSSQETGTEISGLTVNAIIGKINSIASSTGLPVEVVSAVMTYWQMGGQMIDGYPIPMMVRLQDAAAELFNLNLGENGNRLNDFQQFLLDESNRIAEGGRQIGSSTSDAIQRSYVENEHYFWDWFQRDFSFIDYLQKPGAEYEFPFFTPVNLTRNQNEEVKNALELIASDKYIEINYAPNLGDTGKKREEKQKKYDAILKKRREASAEDIEKAKKLYNERMAAVNAINAPARMRGVNATPGTPYADSQEARKALLKHIYDVTQKQLQDKGISQATLFRSLAFTRSQLETLQNQVREKTGDDSFTVFNSDGSFNPSSITGEILSYPRNALESWSYDFLTADSAAGNVDESYPARRVDGSYRFSTEKEPIMAEITLASDFDASRIVSLPTSGFGQYKEGEVVVTGNNEDQVRIVAAHSRRGESVRLSESTRSNSEKTNLALTKRIGRTGSSFWYNNPEILSYFTGNLRNVLIKLRSEAIKKAYDYGFNYGKQDE